MLRASGRLLKPGGCTAFFTIFVTPGLDPRDHRRAVRWGPRAAASRKSPRELLREAGLEGIEEVDVTEAFLETATAWLRHGRRLEPDLRETLGSEKFEELQADREVSVAAIEAGLLRRSLFVATRTR